MHVGQPAYKQYYPISRLPFLFLQSSLRSSLFAHTSHFLFPISKDCGSAIGVLQGNQQRAFDLLPDCLWSRASQSQKQHQRSSLPIRSASSGVNQSDNISAPSSSHFFTGAFNPSPQCRQHVPLYLILLAPRGTKPQPLLERSPSGVHSTTALPRLTNILHAQHSGVCHAVQLELHLATLR